VKRGWKGKSREFRGLNSKSLIYLASSGEIGGEPGFSFDECSALFQPLAGDTGHENRESRDFPNS
jgi:hypothetical protein